jgi:DNA polymerase-3 subunit alpha
MSTPPASERSFAHLHVHTEYSMLDGAARIDELLDAAVRMGMPAIATTDHGYVFGAYEFWSKARKRGSSQSSGSRPISRRAPTAPTRLGSGSATTPANKDDVGGGGAYTHMTLLAETPPKACTTSSGCRSLASIEGYYRKAPVRPRTARPLRQGAHRHHGLPERRGQHVAARGAVRQGPRGRGELRDILGAGNFYAASSWTTACIERRHRDGPAAARQGPGLPLLATNDLHYVERGRLRSARRAAVHQYPATLHDDPGASGSTPGLLPQVAAEQMRESGRSCPRRATTPC